MLEIIVFLGGAGVMVMEILGSRILAPYVGTSIFIWTSLIGIILACLSVGYTLGGRLADKYLSLKLLGGIIVAAALCILVIALSKEIVLTYIVLTVPSIKASAILATIILFTVPSVLLGMVSPYAIRLRITSVEAAGHTVGNLYALSTLGSIIGTFLAGFWLIPTFGTSHNLYILATTLFTAGIFLLIHEKYSVKKVVSLGLVFLLLAGASAPFQKPFYLPVIADIDTPYTRLWIYDYNDPKHDNRLVRLMMNSLIEGYSALFLDDHDLVFDYARSYRLDSFFHNNIQNTLLVGGAAYTVAKDFLERHPEGQMDVVEIDPEMINVAQDYFFIDADNPRLSVFHEDARTFFNKSEPNKYDIIYSDAFTSSLSIPYQLATKESVKAQYDMLTDNGFVLANIISALEGDKGKILRTEYHTFKEYFPHVHLFPTRTSDPTQIQNILLVAAKSPDFNYFDLETKIPNLSEELQSYLQRRWLQPIPHDVPIATDDYAPMDYYGSLIIDSM